MTRLDLTDCCSLLFTGQDVSLLQLCLGVICFEQY